MQAPPPKFVLRGHEGACNCVAFLGAAVLVTGDISGELRIWDLETRSTQTRIRAAHSSSVLSVSRLGEAHFISCGRDEMVRLWDANTDQAVQTLHTQARCFCNASVDRSPGVAPDTNLVLTAAGDESVVQLWDLRSGSEGTAAACQVKLAPELGLVSSLCLQSMPTFQSQFLCALVGCDGGTVSMVDMRSSAPLCSVAAHDMVPVLALDVAPSGRHVVSGGADQKVQRCALSVPPDEASIATTDSVALPVAGTSSVAYRSDGRLCVSGHWDGSVRLTEVTAKRGLKPVAVLRHARESSASIFGVGFGPAGLFASASKDGTVAVWDVFADKMRE